MSSSLQMVTSSLCGITQSTENIGCANYSCLQRSLFLVILLVELVAWTHQQKVADAAAQNHLWLHKYPVLAPSSFFRQHWSETQRLPAQTTHLLWIILALFRALKRNFKKSEIKRSQNLHHSEFPESDLGKEKQTALSVSAYLRWGPLGLSGGCQEMAMKESLMGVTDKGLMLWGTVEGVVTLVGRLSVQPPRKPSPPVQAITVTE